VLKDGVQLRREIRETADSELISDDNLTTNKTKNINCQIYLTVATDNIYVAHGLETTP